MRNKFLRATLIFAAGLATLAASPASAGTYHRYMAWYHPEGAWYGMWVQVGEAVYNDCGQLVYLSGATTPDYTTEYVSVPC